MCGGRISKLQGNIELQQMVSGAIWSAGNSIKMDQVIKRLFSSRWTDF